ncbi:Type II secretion system protein F [Botrimarina colliarenosi]|uniref:Type II secretion system protein F n=1 Tax=Botrimarina colliarenosi TaxID=2528001 RepID=A0A5C6AEZ8_9BACT|nr:type II secretion system F family protein [Botrimarina colliarenosi]TWT97987.1 Type II secretion system protein F [Botrimarina colliarenosi]
MPRFDYQATNDAGAPQRGVIDAAGVAEAVTQLESRGLVVRSIAIAADPLGEAEGPLTEAVKRLLASNDQLVEPLHAYLKESPPSKRRTELKRIAELIATGEEKPAVAAALAEPTAWGSLLASVSAEPGDDESLFARFIEREQPSITLRRRRRLASLYPVAVAALCLAILWPLSLFVLPAFQEIFNDFGLDLPVVTELVLATGRFLTSGRAVTLLTWLTLVAYVGWVFRGSLSRWFSPVTDRIVCFWRGGALGAARLTAQMADLLEAGAPVADAVRIAGRHVYAADKNPGAKRAAWLAREPSRQHLAVSPTCSLDFAVAAEMNDTARVRLLRELSACHNERSAAASSWAEGVAGPVTIVVLGIIVGGVVLALFLPLVKLIEGLT